MFKCRCQIVVHHFTVRRSPANNDHTHTHTQCIMRSNAVRPVCVGYTVLYANSLLLLGTCESFFFVRIESSNRISRIYHASRNTAWRSAGVPYRAIICWRLALWTNESYVRNWVLVHFNCPKTRQTMPLYAYLTPKVDFKRKFNQHRSFLYEWRLTARTIRKFRIGPSLRIESRIGRTIRNRIESRSFAGP